MSLIAKLARLKRKLIKTPLLKDKRLSPYWFDKLLGGKDAFICQIGSNDGKTGDPLHLLLKKHKRWKALFVEPVPYLFNRLKENYSDTARFTFENVAISNGDDLTFYWVDPIAREKIENLPNWFDQLGSFNKEHILKHLDGKLAPYIRSEALESITLPNLLKRNKVSKIDILHIDTEGYDWEILSQFDLEKYNPQFILFEKRHLSKTSLKSAVDFLNKKYQLFEIGMDMLAVNRNTAEKERTQVISKIKPYV